MERGASEAEEAPLVQGVREAAAGQDARTGPRFHLRMTPPDGPLAARACRSGGRESNAPSESIRASRERKPQTVRIRRFPKAWRAAGGRPPSEDGAKRFHVPLIYIKT
jgi:hypothetical protein